MRVTIRFIGLLKRYVGESESVFDVPDLTSAGELLALVGKQYGALLPPNLWNENEARFHKSIRIVRAPSVMLDEAQILEDGDELTVLFGLAGG